MAGEGVSGLEARLDVPYSDGVVPGGADETTVVGEKGDTPDGVGVAREGPEGADVVWATRTGG